jgi:hypothetical protein
MTAPPFPAPQTTRMEGPLDAPIVFGPRRERDLRPVTIRVSSEKARRCGTLELLTGDSKLIERCPVECVGATWEPRLLPGLYRLRWVAADGTVTEGPYVDTQKQSDGIDA